MGTPFEVVAARLESSTLALFREMAAAHVEAGQGERFFMMSGTFAGTTLRFVGDRAVKFTRDKVDPAALRDLRSSGLIRRRPGGGRHNENYELTSDGTRFYRWLRQREGGPITQVDAEVERQLTDGGAFAAAHPSAAAHLRDAFDLLWSGSLDERTVSTFGAHLRHALMDTVDGIVSVGGDREKPVERMKAHLASGATHHREQAVLERLVELLEAVLRLAQRPTHVRNETSAKGEPAPEWSELRRAAFATAFVCHELAQP